MVLALVGVTALAACGDDDGGGATLSEAEYIEAGDDLCANAEEATAAALDDIATQFSEATDIDENEIATLVVDAVVQVMQETIDEFRELEGPERLTADVNELLDEIDATLDEVENDPAILDSIEDPFDAFPDLGFEVCGSTD